MIINLSDRRDNGYMRSDNLQFPRLQLPNSSSNLQLPHGRQCHHSRLGHIGRHGHGGHGDHGGHGGHVGHVGHVVHVVNVGLGDRGQDRTGPTQCNSKAHSKVHDYHKPLAMAKVAKVL